MKCHWLGIGKGPKTGSGTRKRDFDRGAARHGRGMATEVAGSERRRPRTLFREAA